MKSLYVKRIAVIGTAIAALTVLPTATASAFPDRCLYAAADAKTCLGARPAPFTPAGGGGYKPPEDPECPEGQHRPSTAPAGPGAGETGGNSAGSGSTGSGGSSASRGAGAGQ